VADTDFPDDLIELERSAWAAIQARTLTPKQAAAVQARVTAFATETGMPRVEVEMKLKKAVRHAGVDA